MKLNAYLYFDGQCAEAFQLYEKVLHGRLVFSMKYAEAPRDQPVSAGTENRIMHARMVFGDSVLMGSDTPAGMYRKPQGFTVALAVAEPGEAERIYAALADGGKASMPLQETFFAHRFGMLEDRFGTPWLINCEKTQAAPQSGEGGKPFVISRLLDAPRQVVWNAFTQAERLQRWWGPRGVQIEVASLDLRPGGIFHYAMRTPDGKLIWGRMAYRAIEAPSRLHFVNSFSDAQGGVTRHPMAPTWPLEMLSTFTFEEKDSKTLFTVEWQPLNATPEERATFEGGTTSMTSGWTGTLERLESYLAGRPVA
ncbi:MAG: SRPBCC domain-containing protein [Hyphomicrobiaceae bacterium]